MKAKTKFLKMYYKLPEQARREMVIDFATNPKSLNVCCLEVTANTELGRMILIKLGYTDD